MKEPTSTQSLRIFILGVHHGLTHVQIAWVLGKALRQLRPNVHVEIIDTLAPRHRWVREYGSG